MLLVARETSKAYVHELVFVIKQIEACNVCVIGSLRKAALLLGLLSLIYRKTAFIAVLVATTTIDGSTTVMFSPLLSVLILLMFIVVYFAKQTINHDCSATVKFLTLLPLVTHMYSQ